MTGTKATAQVGRSEALAAKAADQTARCTAWLLKFMQNDQPKFSTKTEICHAAMTELEVSKNSFNLAWISAIEQTVAMTGMNRCADDAAPKVKPLR